MRSFNTFFASIKLTMLPLNLGRRHSQKLHGDIKTCQEHHRVPSLSGWSMQGRRRGGFFRIWPTSSLIWDDCPCVSKVKRECRPVRRPVSKQLSAFYGLNEFWRMSHKRTKHNPGRYSRANWMIIETSAEKYLIGPRIMVIVPGCANQIRSRYGRLKLIKSVV